MIFMNRLIVGNCVRAALSPKWYLPSPRPICPLCLNPTSKATFKGKQLLSCLLFTVWESITKRMRSNNFYNMNVLL